MKKVNTIQFTPYYPPHKGGLETHAQERSKWRNKMGYGKVINFSSDIDIPVLDYKKDKNGIPYLDEDGVITYFLPSFEIIPTFVCYKFWERRVRNLLNSAYPPKSPLEGGSSQIIVITRTRFFLTTLIGGIFAKLKNLQRIHIEHGSDYVKMDSKRKNIIAFVYDWTLGLWVFRSANKVIAISKVSQKFCQKFTSREIPVTHRGMDLINSETNNHSLLKDKFPSKTIIGFLGRLYKRKNVDSLIKAYYKLDDKTKDNTQLVIVGEGEVSEQLKKLDTDNIIYFTGGVDHKKAVELQNEFDIHVHSSSPGGALSSTLLQAMRLGCMIVSTPHEGADEVIQDNINGILLPNDSAKEIERGLKLALKEIHDKKNIRAKYNKDMLEKDFQRENVIKKYHDSFKIMK